MKSNCRTPCAVPAKRAISTTQTGTDVELETPKQNKMSNLNPVEASDPQPKRLRRTNREGSGFTIYNSKYHPMDEVLRPNSKATVRARKQRLINSFHQSDLISTDNPVSNSEKIAKKPRARKKSIRSSQSSRTKPVRSSPRFTGHANKKNEKRAYDMKYHPIDDVLKTKARKKRSQWFETVLLPSTPSPTSISPNMSSTSAPSPICTSDPSTKPIPLGWQTLNHFDRRIYSLQQGAPLDGETLPLTWPQVVESLVREGFFSEEDFKMFGGMEALRSRYETIRLRVENLFGSNSEPADKRDWPIMYLEDVRVFKLDSNTKYWSHPTHNLVIPKSTLMEQNSRWAASNDRARNTTIDLHQRPSGVSHPCLENSESRLRRPSDGKSSLENTDELADEQTNSFGEAFDLLSGSGQADGVNSSDIMGHDPILSTPKKKPFINSFQIREDEAGRTPKIRKYVSMNPASPGTDIQKENFENHLNSPSEDGERNYYRLSPTEQRLVSMSSSRSARFQAVGAVWS